MTRILMERSGEMEVFVRVVQEAGFSAAARSLDLTPSAVSKLIGRLERRLGARLLSRTTRALTLTAEGEAYFRAASRILQDLNEADQAMAGGTLRGRLHVNTTIPFGTMYVAPSVPLFVRRHPEILIDLSFTDAIVDLVAERADVAIRIGNLPDSSLIARKLGQSRRMVCAAPCYLAAHGRPATPGDLARHECLTFNFRRGIQAWPFRVNGKTVEQPVGGRTTVNNGETMRHLTLAGAGIARLGLFHVCDDIKAGRLVPLLEKFNPGDLELIHAVHVGGGPVSHRVRAFIDFMAERLAKVDVLKGRG
jgi:DNA-binding transcriptional LysR family regulator